VRGVNVEGTQNNLFKNFIQSIGHCQIFLIRITEIVSFFIAGDGHFIFFPTLMWTPLYFPTCLYDCWKKANVAITRIGEVQRQSWTQIL
jgi:hypothetical protein